MFERTPQIIYLVFRLVLIFHKSQDEILRFIQAVQNLILRDGNDVRPGYSTRLGAALRHAGVDLRLQHTHRRLVLVISDGEPSDVDCADPHYLVEDARRAVQSLGAQGIDVFCVGLDSGGDAYLARIFGRNVTQLDRIERLPERLPMLYLRLTA